MKRSKKSFIEDADDAPLLFNSIGSSSPPSSSAALSLALTSSSSKNKRSGSSSSTGSGGGGGGGGGRGSDTKNARISHNGKDYKSNGSTASIFSNMSFEDDTAILLNNTPSSSLPPPPLLPPYSSSSSSTGASSTAAYHHHIVPHHKEQIIFFAQPNATFHSSFFNLTNTILGSGVLALPSAMRMCGVVLGTLLILIGGLASSFGLHLLVECARRTGQVGASYFTVAKNTYPKAAKIIDLAVALKCYGVSISYLIIIGDLIPPAMISLFDISETSVLADRRLWIGIATIILLPISFLKQMNSLRWTSVTALITVIYLCFVVIGYYIANGVQVNVNEYILEYWRWDIEVFSALPIIVFAFTCHQNIFTIYNELEAPTDRRISGVIFSSIISCFLVYVGVGVFGYLSFRGATMGNIIKNYEGSDVVINILRIAIAILAVFSYPLQLHPCRNSIENLFFAASPLHQEFRRRIIESLIICCTTFLIAFFISDLDLILGIVGATGSTTLCYLLPGLFYLKLEKESPWHLKKVASLILVIFGIIMVGIGNAIVIDKAINPENNAFVPDSPSTLITSTINSVTATLAPDSSRFSGFYSATSEVSSIPTM